jgi:hypothetical protein
MKYEAGSVRDIPVNAAELCGLTWSGEFLWFSDAAFQQIQAIDPQSGEVVQKLECPGVQTDLTTVDGLLVQVVTPDRKLRMIDPQDGATVREWDNPCPGAELCGLEATGSGIWIGYEQPAMLEFRRRSDFELLERLSVSRPVAGVTATDRFVAFAEHAASEVHILDPTTGRIMVSIGVNGHPTGMTWDGARLWYCDYASVQLRAIEVPGVVSRS